MTMTENDRVNILLVDDQPAKLLSYEEILRGLGENLIRAGSAREALEYLLKKDIAVILIDVIMPDLDGFELAAMIRSHPRFQTTAMIFVSAVALADIDRLKGYEYGAVDYVPVPVVPEVLRAKVRVFIDLYRKTRQLEQLNAELEQRVEERTAELARTNAELEQRVEERTRERELAWAQIHEMQKLESLGQLTGGLAHDFNNLLMAILANLDLLTKHLPENATTTRLIAGAIRGAERGAALTRRMLAFARRQELKPETVDLARLIGGMADMLRRSLGPEIEIGMEFPNDLPHTRVDPNQLELALLNLALNARDAMPKGGQLAISARTDKIAGKHVRGLQEGDYVCISVRDTGKGMDEMTLKRAAEPFFTTKGVGKGTGLGLSMVHGLAAQSGGDMRISSELDHGTTVELWLPTAPADALPATKPVAAPPPDVTKQYRVLVVDDDEMIAEGTAAMLEDLGHSVLVALSGADALDHIRSEKFDLVITDHAMPGMTGLELAQHIPEINPDLPVVLATGYAEFADNEEINLPRLAKPYRQPELSRLITKVLNPEFVARQIGSA